MVLNNILNTVVFVDFRHLDIGFIQWPMRV